MVDVRLENTSVEIADRLWPPQKYPFVSDDAPDDSMPEVSSVAMFVATASFENATLTTPVPPTPVPPPKYAVPASDGLQPPV